MSLLSIIFISSVIVTITKAYKEPCDTFTTTTCDECIRIPSCAWCYDSKNVTTSSKCFQTSALSTNECDIRKIFNPDNQITITSNNDLTIRGHRSSNDVSSSLSFGGSTRSQSSSSSSTNVKDITQIKPQEVQIKLRPGLPSSIQMHFTQAEDFLMDVYYLVNNGNSMKEHTKKLSTLGDSLVEHLQNMTANFRLGLGTTSSSIPKKANSPCQDCHTSYTFKNEITLSQNTVHFSHFIHNISIADNMDVPEGELDAVMQTLVCRHNIGWRYKAKRLLIFSPGNGFQKNSNMENDLVPNDGNCHLDERGYYSLSSKQVSPNVTQINTQLRDNSIQVIFPVVADKLDICHKLVEQMEEATCALLADDPSNIIELIEERYRSISSTVELKHNASSAVTVRFFSRCFDRFGAKVETNSCEGLKVGDVFDFEIQLEVTECPTDPKDYEQHFQIYPVGTNESLSVHLTMLCDCACKYGNYERCGYNH